MNKLTTTTILAVFIAAVLLVGCGDGTHRSKPGWGYTPVNEEVSGNTALVTLNCVSVVNYDDIKASDLASQNPEDLTTGDITAKSVSATTVMFKLANSKLDDATKALHKCIEIEIDTMKGSGSEHYWNNMTYILTRNKTKKPKKTTVSVVDLTGCSQIQSADCLLTD
jgi:hypothetical protein